MDKEEWKKLTDDTRPALRFCAPVGSAYTIKKSSAQSTCEWCSCAIWYDTAQEMPDFIRARGTVMVCASCVMEDDEMADAVVENLPAVYSEWVKTGIVKPFRFGDKET